jgi:hypothetical protein
VFYIACSRGDTGLVQFLLEDTSKDLSDGALTLGIGLAASANHIAILHLIQSCIPERFNTCVQPPALIDAAINGHSEVARVLLPTIIDKKQAAEWGLVEAARHGS